MFHGHLLGLYEKALPAEWSWERRLSAARELGFDYMEISIYETDGRMARLWWILYVLLNVCHGNH